MMMQRSGGKPYGRPHRSRRPDGSLATSIRRTGWIMPVLRSVWMMGGLPSCIGGAAFAAFALLNACCMAPAAARSPAQFRPPAVPLVTFDPYMSIWSENNHLAKHPTRFWDGRLQPLTSLIRIDGKVWRLMGNAPSTIPAMHQVSVMVRPTTTVYQFDNSMVAVTLTFTTPRLPSHLKTMTLPVTYISWSVRCIDGRRHTVQLYYSTGGNISLNDRWQYAPLSCWRQHFGRLTALRCGNEFQHYFDVVGDQVGLDWGYIYTVASKAQSASQIAPGKETRLEFVKSGKLASGGQSHRVIMSPKHPAEAFAFNLGRVGPTAVHRHVMVAYDEVYSIDYFGQYQRPYWRHIFKSPAAMFLWAANHYHTLMQQSAKFDREVMADAQRIGGFRYATIVSLAYRQALAAMGITADRNGMPMVYTKEETSNGDTATVDVIFPASPLLLTFCPQLEAASIVPVLNSADTPRWRFPWSPHDLGTYPVCAGWYANGGENMPIEESGNMIILAAAIAKAERNADLASRYWPLLKRWALYLRKLGFDPKNQLSTDDFLGPRPHNSNLSLKAIVALRAYGMLLHMRGDDHEAKRYTALSRRWAHRWLSINEQDGHFRAQFNVPGGWGEPYNMVWGRVLGFHLFPYTAVKRELTFLISKANRFGIPLNNATTGSDTDHTIYTAALARTKPLFDGFINPLYRFLNDSPDRVPLADWYDSRTGAAFMHARPVVGAAFVEFMRHENIWRKWVSRGAAVPGRWAPLPPLPAHLRPRFKVVVPTSQFAAAQWHYTTHKPQGRWYAKNYNDRGWKVGPAGFGSGYPPGGAVHIRTRWTTANLWLRRTFIMPTGHFKHLRFYTFHDEDVAVFINGVFAASAGGYSNQYVGLNLTPAGLAALHPGKNIFAVHVHQTTGGQFFDGGLAEELEPGRRQH